MIREEDYSETLTRHYSDAYMKIRQIETGALYEEAVDVKPCRYTYEETDIPRAGDEEATPEEVEAALEAIL